MELSVKHLRQAKFIFQYGLQSKKLTENKNHNLRYWLFAGTFFTGVWQVSLPSLASSSPELNRAENNSKSDNASEDSSEALSTQIMAISPPQSSIDVDVDVDTGIDINISKAEFSSSSCAMVDGKKPSATASKNSTLRNCLSNVSLAGLQKENIEEFNIGEFHTRTNIPKENDFKEKSESSSLTIEKIQENPTFSNSNINSNSNSGSTFTQEYQENSPQKNKNTENQLNTQSNTESNSESSIKSNLIAINKAEKIDFQENISILTKITSVSELSDVKPTDWAYQSLKKLIERYGVISGFPDGSFKGNSTISRYEFAAALSATIDKLEDLLAKSLGNEYIQQDMIVVRRLQREYAKTLEKVRQRLGKLDQKVYDLEQQVFSPTTKLKGEQIFAFTDGGGANQTLISRTRLNLLSSFSGSDFLITQFESGNNGGDAIAFQQGEGLNLLGVNGAIANGGGLDYAEVENRLKLRRLYYTFRLQKDIAVSIGTKMSPRDFIDANGYADNEAVDFSSGFFLNNPLIVQNQIDRRGGAGIAVVWKPKKRNFAVRSLYIAGEGNQIGSTTSNDGGLFGDPYQASLELEYAASKKLTLRLQYTNAEVNNTDINAWGINAEYRINRNTGIFTRLGYGKYQGFNTLLNETLDLTPVSWSVGLGIRNLFLPGTTAGAALGQPFVSGGLGNSTQTNFEAFYNLQLTDNISIAPIFTLVNHADNDSSNGLTWQGSFRTVIEF